MKQKFFALICLILFSTGINYAVDSKNGNPENANSGKMETLVLSDQLAQNDANGTSQSMNHVIIAPSKKQGKFFSNILKKNFMPQMIKGLVFAGLLVMLVGALLAALGVALIPAIILAVVGCVLMILGALL
jgi:hypothetical protein